MLYCGFECAGGNHIFRYDPHLQDGKWIDAAAKIPRGDKYHEFSNSKAEHKLFLARCEPGTGKYLAGQQFCGRLDNGKANAVRLKNGAIAASDAGHVLAGGAAPSGLPISLMPPETGEYTGGSFVMGLRPDLKERVLATRLQANATTHALDARRVDGKLVVVAGGTNSDKADTAFWTTNALQP